MTDPVGRPGQPAPVDPWVRWGWLMAVIWLVFLAFPILDLVGTDRPAWLRATLAVLLVVFVVVYVHGFLVLGRSPSIGRRGPVLGTLALVALTVAGIALQGSAASGLSVYTCAYALALAPVRVAAATALGAVVLLPAGAALVPGEGDLVFILPVLLAVVGGMTIVRVLDERSHITRELAEERAVVSERERVARDVHDVLGHSLTVVVTKAELAERLVDLDPERAKAELAQVQALSREALAEIRATVAGLRVARLGEELAGARAALAAAGIGADVPEDGDLVDPRHRLVLAWVLREAVTNVVRHSAASRCRVELGPRRLVVADDGRGRGTAAAGNGLRGIGERVRAAGGTLRMADEPGGGTRLEVEWT